MNPYEFVSDNEYMNEINQELINIGMLVHEQQNQLYNFNTNTSILCANPSFDNINDVQYRKTRIEELYLEGIGKSPCLISESGNIYEFIRTLRKCIYGKVKHAVRVEKNIQTNQYYRTNDELAIKVISKDILKNSELHENPIDELKCQSHLGNPGHENILAIFECLENADFIFAVMPYCNGGELFTSVETKGAMQESQALYWFRQIISGLSYIQSRFICHRDMSLENVLIHDNKICKIIDFGLAVGIPVDENGMTYSLPPIGAIGKIFYMAPEIYQNNIPYNGFCSDIWSVGIMLFIMVTGSPPFERPDHSDPRYKLIVQGNLSPMLDSWGMTHISSDVRDLLTKILVPEQPQNRLTIPEIINHPWLRR